MDESTKTPQRRVAVVGAGLVGCLAACMFAKQGWHVDLYESHTALNRPRLTPPSADARARSINLAVSARGIEALRSVGEAMTERLLEGVIPMKGRMIHDLKGNQGSQNYSLDGQCINSIDRLLLNHALLEEAARLPLVFLHFEHRLMRANFDAQELAFRVNGQKEEEVVKGVTLTVGTDGCRSSVRGQILRVTRMQYSQQYIDSSYLELSIPPSSDPVTGEATFALDPNHLHIWPRQTFMLIALPNQDKSFTCTLFAPQSIYDALPPPQTPEEEKAVLDFFRREFGNALPLIGEKELVRCFREHPRGALVTIKCEPYHYKDRAIILGDAAHCMAPFYGQGMNCGLEDVRHLSTLLASNPTSLSTALSTYTSTRHEDLVAICDLAMRNYDEMRRGVVDWRYLVRKRLDGVLERLAGRGRWWAPLYTMVTFRPDLSYSQVVRREARQAAIVDWTLRIAGMGLGGGLLSVGLIKWASWRR